MKEEKNDFCEFVSKYVILRDKRIFIDICEQGCGSGCAYCYVHDNNLPQVLLSEAQIEFICNEIKSNCDCTNKIISLCPNTEPLKSVESMKRILFIIHYFIPLGCFIQISTKEVIPDFFLQEINEISNNRIYINISIPFLINTNQIEPYAGAINDRLKNFRKIKLFLGLNACLYIKPFLAKTHKEQNLYIEIIKEYKIEMICVGVKFDIDITHPCTSLHDREIARQLINNQLDHINNFVSLVREVTGARVYVSSICCIYENIFQNCELQLFDYNKMMCEDCTIWRKNENKKVIGKPE